MTRNEAERRAAAIAVLRTSNLERVPTNMLVITAVELTARGAVRVQPAYDPRNSAPPPVDPWRGERYAK